MPDTYRSAILLHDVHGLSGPEIAAVLDVPLPTVKIRLHRARLRLKDLLEGGCQFSCDDRGVLVCEPKE
jgi:RNA polymerase sigma-70 factor (ECF subfamily)